MEEILRTENLGHAYSPGRFALRNLNVALHKGEILGLLGRNGAGKTTTVRVLTTILPPTEGTAWVFGEDLRKAGREYRRRLGVVLQAESLDFVSVERNLVLYAFLWGVPREVAKSRAEEMLELFELSRMRERKPWALSGGERRRFQVARELMHDMDLLFLDEPTVGLDAVVRRRILAYLGSRAQKGLSIVFTTHVLEEADRLCDRIAVMHKGHLIALDSPEVLKRTHGGAREVAVEFSAPLSPTLKQSLVALAVAEGATLVPEDPGSPGTVTFSSLRAEELISAIATWANRSNLQLSHVSLSELTLENAFLGLIGEEVEG
jgi:ABC-2 type transport system ATP-binding protein